MLRKQLATAIGLSSLLACGTASAQSFSFSELIQLGSSLSELSDTVSNADLSSSSGTVTLNDGTTLQVSTTDGSSLSSALQGNSSRLRVNGNEVGVTTSAGSLENAYQNSSSPANFSISAVVDSRPITLEWEGPLEDLETQSNFQATLNGRSVTLELPAGTTLADLDDATNFVIIDNETGKRITNLRDILTLTEIGNADMLLRASQKQFMAQTFGTISRQIANSTQTGFTSFQTDTQETAGPNNHVRPDGINLWVASEIADLSGDTPNFGYSGTAKSSIFGVDHKANNWLGGVALGYSNIDLSGKGRHIDSAQISGNFIAPYGALMFLDNNLVLDGILLYQDVEGDYRNGNEFNSIDWDGHRYGARAAASYFFPEVNNIRTGITAGGAYLKDDLDGEVLSSTNDYGTELGEVFAGAKASYAFTTGYLYGSVLHYEDISSDFDSTAELVGSDDNRTELELGASHRLGQNMNFNISARTTLGSNDTEYTAVQAAIVYPF